MSGFDNKPGAHAPGTGSHLVRSQSGAITGFRQRMLMTTVDAPPGKRIARTLGIVRGNAVRARHVGHDIIAGLKNLVGGEISEYTKMLGETREQALDRMAEQAHDLGGNAIVGIRFSTSMIMGGAAELLAYGTAVVLEEGQPSP